MFQFRKSNLNVKDRKNYLSKLRVGVWIESKGIGDFAFPKITRDKILVAIPTEILVCTWRGWFIELNQFLEIDIFIKMLKNKLHETTCSSEFAVEIGEWFLGESFKTNSGAYLSYNFFNARLVAMSEMIIKPLDHVQHEREGLPSSEPIVFDRRTGKQVLVIYKNLVFCKQNKKS